MSSLTGQPMYVLNEKSKRVKGKDAFNLNVDSVKALSGAIQTTFGPKGMSKMLLDGLGDITITNDGAKILEELQIEHPAARMIKEMGKTIKKSLGDGSSTAIILTGELLNRASEMLNSGLSPVHVYEGYLAAMKKAIQIIDEYSSKIEISDKKALQKIASSILETKMSIDVVELFSIIIIDATMQIIEKQGKNSTINLDNIQFIKKHGEGIKNSQLISGLIIDKEVVSPNMPKIIKDAKIALIDAALEIVKTEYTSEIQIKNPAEIQNYLIKEEKILKDLVEYIHNSGANVVFCQKGIDETTQNFLSNYGIMAIRRVKHSDMVKLSLATGAKIITQIKSLSKDDLGYAESMYERKIGKDNMIFIEGCTGPKAVTVLIRGGSEQIIDDAERTLKNTFASMKTLIENMKVIGGGGSIEVELSNQLFKFAQQQGGKSQIAIENFAHSLTSIPITLIQNAGKNPLDLLTEMKSKVSFQNNKIYGFNAYSGNIEDVALNGILDISEVKKQVLKISTEQAVMFIRIDDIIKGHSRKVKN